MLHTLPPDEVSTRRAVAEFELLEAAEEVARTLPGAEIAGVRGSIREILALLDARRPDVIFNLCEAPLGRPGLESHVAALFEWLGLPFTGAGSETLALCRRKDRTNAILAAAGVPVPRNGVFPCIVKPADEDGSVGIDAYSICADAHALTSALARLAGPVLVEEFLPGKEFVVSLWGRTDATHVSIGEASFEKGMLLFTYASKWDSESPDFSNSRLHYHTPIESALRATLTATARAAWRVVGARGYLRVDLRLDDAGVPRVLDVNPNPEISPGMGMHRAVTEAGWTWERFTRQQIAWACGREVAHLDDC
ncbi:MAG: ATP-grasp domain-containing protein [Gemmataceae bacterium]|nr:ATP-grasp domain-containing protein [Gemmataceae bacterium]MCI0741216.1 ATP-grasp domain-containing protein [Gemmataceae bacterium]